MDACLLLMGCGAAMSLYEIAPRLAKAHYGAKWEMSTLDELPGRLREVLTHEHSTGRCFHCRGVTDRDELTDRMLQGCNKGVYGVWYSEKCRSCKTASGSNWRRPW